MSSQSNQWLFVGIITAGMILLAVFRRIEELKRLRRLLRQQQQQQLRQQQQHHAPIILKGLEEDERLRIFERVLDCRSYSTELVATVKMERERVDDYKEHTDIRIVDKVSKNIESQGNEKIRHHDEEEALETCAICMEDFQVDQDVIIGDNCVHMYHKDCLLRWMQAKHDHCPYCREYIFVVKKFISVAREEIGEERFKTLIKIDDKELVAMYLGNDEEVDNGDQIQV